jgi:hypothetical protein
MRYHSPFVMAVMITAVLLPGLSLAQYRTAPSRSLSIFTVDPVTADPWNHGKAPSNKPESGSENGEFESDPEERKEWFISQRMYPFNKLPDDARRRAWASRPPDAPGFGLFDSPRWKPIGPRPTLSDFPNNWGVTSGRINSVAVSPADPNHILVGASTGGIWRSTNGGVNFEPVSDSQVDLAVGSIAYAPSDPSIVYAGMGDVGNGYLGSGVLRSNDGGATWTRVNNTTLPSPGTVSRIVVDVADPNRVYLAQYSMLSGPTVFSSGFFLSTDGGVNWTRTLAGLPRDVVRHPTDPNILYLAMTRIDFVTPSTGGVWRSVNRGSTWERIYTSPYTSSSNMKVAVTPAAPSNIYVLAASGSSVVVEGSNNGGGAWVNLGANVDTGQISYNCYLFVHPSDPNTIFIGTRDLWRSTNGGSTYTNITNNFTVAGGYNPTISRSHPDQHHFYISPSDPNTFYVANDGGLSKTVDGGSTFTSLNGTLGLTQFVSIDLHPTANLRTYGGAQDNGTQRRFPNSAWDEFISGDGGQVNIDPLDPSIVFVTYVRHTVHRFTNNGNNFQATIGNSTVFNSDRVAFYPPFVGNGVNSNLYFGTYRLYISANRGASWSAPGGTQDLTGGSGTLSAIAVSRSDLNTIYTGASDGTFMVSTNNGATWTNRSAGLPQRTIKSIAVSRTDPNTVFVTVSGFATPHVYKSLDGGANWVNISGNLPDIPVNTILLDPRPGYPNVIYVGTDIGVLRSVTGGNVWQTFNVGMPPVVVTELVGLPNGLVQLSTYGRGAYEINLNGSRTIPYDFDGDRRADLSVFRPSNRLWYLQRGIDGYVSMEWGQDGDIVVPADYDGDGKAEVGMFRPSNGTWYLFNSGTQSFQTVGWGQNGDRPAPADHDGDGRADLVVFRPSTGQWFVKFSSDNSFTSVDFGVNGDRPVIGDFDGDGRDDIGLYRPSDNNWYLRNTTEGFWIHTWGEAGDIPVPADYDGDGETDIAVFRPGTGQWFLKLSSGFFDVKFWGQNLDVPVAADYDGDGKADPAVFRPSDGQWYVMGSNAGIMINQFGNGTDRPLPNAFNY